MGLQAAVAAGNDTSEMPKKSDTVATPTDGFQVCEHIASFWLDDDNYKWYLGVSEHCAENSPDDYHISYFNKASKDGTNRNYPELEKKNIEQIIGRILIVSSYCYAVIRCTISPDLD